MNIFVTNNNDLEQSGTKINKNVQDKNMQTHKARISNFQSFYNLTLKQAEEAAVLLDTNLLYGYTDDVKQKTLKNKRVFTKQTIRFVKMGYRKNSVIFKYLIELAADLKARAGAAVETVKDVLSE